MSTAHIIYAALFRLTVIAAGFGCVAMGYRLFVLGVMPKDGSEIDAHAGEIRLTLKNAAPGTCFAALGVFMIAIMLFQGNPEYRVITEKTKGGNPSQVQLWRSNGDVIASAINRGRDLENEGQLDNAIVAYAGPLKNKSLTMMEATEPLRAIAAVYMKQERLDEAIAYSLLAYQVDPKHAGGLAQIGEILYLRGKYETAVEFMSQAAQIDPAFISKRDRMKEDQP